jgi:hypothetical protein
MNPTRPKARDIEALTFIYSPPPTANRAERRWWWRSAVEGHSIMVAVTVLVGMLAFAVWSVYRP